MEVSDLKKSKEELSKVINLLKEKQEKVRK